METIKRRQHSLEEKLALLELYKNSGLSKRQWCRKNSIGLSTLQRWLEPEKRQISKANKQTWLPVIATKQEKSAILPIQIGKITIAVDEKTNMQLLSTVAKALLELC